MEFLIILLLILANGIFAMAELALVSARKFRLEAAKKRKKPGAKAAVALSEEPTKFLSTVQIGITSIGILLGIYSGDKITADLSDWLAQISFIVPHQERVATIIVVVLITYLSIVLGELVPKRIGMRFPEQIILVLARPMRLLALISSPFVYILSSTNNFLLALLGIRDKAKAGISEEEIKSMVRESAETGEIEQIEQNIVNRVFELGDRQVRSICTHRSQVAFLSLQDSYAVMREKIRRHKHSAYPVSASQELNDLVGIVLLKDLFSAPLGRDLQLKNLVRKPLYFHENTPAYRVLELFQEKKMHYGMVVDEYGSIEGIVTMDDVLDALIGAKNDLEKSIVARDESSWYVDGHYPLSDFAQYFDIVLDSESRHYQTVAGLFMHHTESLADTGERIQLANYTLEVADMDGPRIDKFLIFRS